MTTALDELDFEMFQESWEQSVKLHGLAKNIAGQRFTRLVAVKPAEEKRNHAILWECLCDCGNRVRVRGTDLRNGKTKSCGCLNREVARNRHLSHGMKGTHIYRVWQGMKARCLFPSVNSYPNYGGRGIRVCQQWLDSFDDFHFYVAQLPHFDETGYQLDRIDNEGNYEPGNVKWSTRAEQSTNRRSNINLTYNGKTQCLQQWANDTGIPAGTIKNRLQLGWSIERAINTHTGKMRDKS